MTNISKSKALERLQKACGMIPALKQYPAEDQEFERWWRNTRVAIEYAFGESSKQVRDFTQIPFTARRDRNLSKADNQKRYAKAYQQGLDTAYAVLQSMIDEIEEFWVDDDSTSGTSEEEDSGPANNRVFIIHGREGEPKEKVARFLKKIKLDPVILSEEANQSQTVIEKFEEYAETTGFAIALLTPDDFGALKEAEEKEYQPRARQNVIFELGYFMGQLGRNRVCALTKGNIERPSDQAGVVYIEFDNKNAWQKELFRELKKAGFDIDANHIF